MVRKLLRDDEFKVGDLVVMIGDYDEWLVYANPSKTQYFLKNTKTGQYVSLSKDWVEGDFVGVGNMSGIGEVDND